MRSLICVSASTTVQSLDSLYFYRKTLHTECGCSALAKLKLEIHWVLCTFNIYIKRFLRIDVCAMQECSMYVCECIHFRLDLSEGFFVSLHFIMLLICSNDWYSSLSLLFLLHRRNFHVDCFQYYIFFHPSILCIFLLNCGLSCPTETVIGFYLLVSFWKSTIWTRSRDKYFTWLLYFFILSCFRSKNQNTWFKSNCMIIFYYVFNRKSVKIQWTLDINHLPQLSIMGILLRYKFGYRQYDIRRLISI